MMIITQNIKLSMIIIINILVKFNLFPLLSNRVRTSKQRRTARKVSIVSVDSLRVLCYVNYQKGPQQCVSIITDTCLLWQYCNITLMITRQETSWTALMPLSQHKIKIKRVQRKESQHQWVLHLHVGQDIIFSWLRFYTCSLQNVRSDSRVF